MRCIYKYAGAKVRNFLHSCNTPLVCLQPVFCRRLSIFSDSSNLGATIKCTRGLSPCA